MEEEIFKKSIIQIDKLLKYGFIKEKENYIYKKDIMDNNLQIIIAYKDDKIKGKIIDKELDDEYLNYRVENQIGEFVNSIREEFINLLEDIKDKCCIENTYISKQANRISSKIREKYNDKPEFLWEDDKNSVFRNKQNKKWYGIIMYINKNRLTDEDKMVEVMNVKLSTDKIEELVNKKGYFRAYHMNKKYWISFILDDTLSDDEIMERIEESYNYTIETNEWVIPANPKYFDIINFFKNKNIIDWHQPSSINIGDIVYLYVGVPYSCIMYKCKVLEKDIESTYPGIDKKIMKLKLLKTYPKDKYTFDIVKEYDLKAIRGARRMPIKLINKMKEDELDD